MNNIKAVIFDMGGVLLRTEDPSFREQAGKPYHMDALQLANFVFGSEAGLQATMGLLDDAALYQEIGKQLNLSGDGLQDFITLFWKGDKLDDDLVNFLRSLRPQFKTGLLSNAWPGARKALTELYPCIDAFDVAVISAEVGLMKPFEEIYRLILQKMDIKPQEAIFVDDMPVNVEAANKIGIHGIQFTDPQATIDTVTKLLNGGTLK